MHLVQHKGGVAQNISGNSGKKVFPKDIRETYFRKKLCRLKNRPQLICTFRTV